MAWSSGDASPAPKHAAVRWRGFEKGFWFPLANRTPGKPEDNAMRAPVHTPILTAELLEHLQLGPGARCIDATIDGGGHTAAMLERIAPEGEVLGIDRDAELLDRVRRVLNAAVEAGRLHLCAGDFRQLAQIAGAHQFAAVQAVI